MDSHGRQGRRPPGRPRAGNPRLRADRCSHRRRDTRDDLRAAGGRARHRFDAAAPREASELRGSVSELVYLGHRIRLQVEMTAGSHLWANLRDEEAADLTAGSAVAVRWSPGATSAWAEMPGTGRKDDAA